MTPDFDPYHKWLGIPPHEQPPHHYRLLGISLFESDSDVIEHAADRQMAHLRTHASGPNAAWSQTLLNQISAAKLCLLNPTRRGDYDAQLRAQSAPAPSPASVAPQPAAYAPMYPQPVAYHQPVAYPQPVAPQQTYPAQPYAPVPLAPLPSAPSVDEHADPAEGDYSVGTGSGSRSRRRASGKTSLSVKIVGQVVASVVGLTLGYFVLCQINPRSDFLGLFRSSTTEDNRAKHGGPTATVSDPTTRPNIKQPPPTKRPAADGSASPGKTSNPPEPKKVAGTSGNSNPATPPASDKAVDLLRLLDLEHAVVEGQWLREGEALIGKGKDWPRITLPAKDLPEEYSLTIEAERLEGNQLLGLGLICNNQQAFAVLDMQGESGLHTLDNRPAGDNESTKKHPPLFAQGEVTRVTALVRKNQIMISVGGRTIIDWKGDSSRLSVGQNWEVPDPHALFLGVWLSTYRFTKIELKPLSAGGNVVAASSGSKPAPPQSQPPPKTNLPKKRPPPKTLGDLLDSPKKPVPSDIDRKAAEKRLREEFKDDFSKSKKDPAQQSALAKKLLSRVRGTVGKSAEMFAGLELAAELAGTAADIKTAGEALDELGSQFQVDVLARKEEAIKDVAKRAKTPDDYHTVAEIYRQLLNAAVADDRYESAIRFAKLAKDASLKSNDPLLNKLLTDGTKDLQSMKAAYDEVSSAKEKLLKSTDDPEACRQWGRFLCLYKNQWETGRALWVQGADRDPLAALSAEDLDAPKTAAAQVALADRWWDAAAAETQALPQRLLQQRAVYWYKFSLPSLSAAEKLRVEGRLQEHGQVGSQFPAGKWVDLLPMIDLNRHQVKGAWARRGKEIGIKNSPEVARLIIPVAPTGSWDLDVQYTILKETDANVILPVGDRQCLLVLNGWGGTVSGLDLVGNVIARDNSTAHKHARLPLNQKLRLMIHVETSGKDATVKATLNNQEWVKYSGPTAALSVTPAWRLPQSDTLGLGTWKADVIFHWARLRINSGSARVITN